MYTLWPQKSAGKTRQLSLDWCRFCIWLVKNEICLWLVESMLNELLQPIAEPSHCKPKIKCKNVIGFRFLIIPFEIFSDSNVIMWKPAKGLVSYRETEKNSSEEFCLLFQWLYGANKHCKAVVRVHTNKLCKVTRELKQLMNNEKHSSC